MLHYLRDCQQTTPIGMLPDIINHNNSAIKEEFSYIYDSDMNRLTKSLYAPTGSVKAHYGEFVNLTTEYLTVKNIDGFISNIEGMIDNYIDKNYDDLLRDKISIIEAEGHTHDFMWSVQNNNEAQSLVNNRTPYKGSVFAQQKYT